MNHFDVVLFTAPPPGQTGENGGAFVKIDGRESLLRAIELFLNREGIGRIQLVVPPDLADETRQRHGPHLSFSGVKLLSGGPRWIDQITASAENLSPETRYVFLHDAARPAVSYVDIEALMAAAESHPAVALSTPLRASLIELDEGTAPMAYHSANRFAHLLAPQVFHRDTFLQMAKTRQEIHASRLKLLNSSPFNVRIASPADAKLVEAMLRLLPKPRPKAASNPFEEAQW